MNKFFKNYCHYYRDGELPWRCVSIVEKMKKVCYLFAGSADSDYVLNTSYLKITIAGTFVA